MFSNILLIYMGSIYRMFGFNRNIITYWKLALSFTSMFGIITLMGYYFNQIKALDENQYKAILMEMNKICLEKK